jgi:hypothetical protein
LVVGDVAVIGLAMNRHSAIGADRDAEQELFQIGAMILIVAKGDVWRAVALGDGILVLVSSGESHGGGVVMQLGKVDVKLLHSADDEGRQQTGAVGTIEAVEGAAETIVAETVGLLGLQAEMFRHAAAQPLGQRVQGPTCEQKVGDQGTEGDGRRDVFGTARDGRQVACQQGLELEAVQEAADDGSGADLEGFEGGLVERGSHRYLRAKESERADCYEDRGTNGKAVAQSKKILARLRAARVSLARIFLLVKACGRLRKEG